MILLLAVITLSVASDLKASGFSLLSIATKNNKKIKYPPKPCHLCKEPAICMNPVEAAGCVSLCCTDTSEGQYLSSAHMLAGSENTADQSVFR